MVRPNMDALKSNAVAASANCRSGIKRAALSDGGPPAKKTCEDDSILQLRQTISEVKNLEYERRKKGRQLRWIKPDFFLSMKHPLARIYKDYKCVLNQTDISNNTNDFYDIQIVKNENSYFIFTRRGRVGMKGKERCYTMANKEEAVASFMKKFKGKTKIDWECRNESTLQPGTYNVVDTVEKYDLEYLLTRRGMMKDCPLPWRTQVMMKLIVANDMHSSLRKAQSDTWKMPLGKLSKLQIAKGLEILIDIEDAIKKNKPQKTLVDLSSLFYTLIPHSCGPRPNVLPVLNSEKAIQEMKTFMLTLAQIEVTQNLKQDESNKEIHPLLRLYQGLDCRLDYVDKDSAEFKFIQDYAASSSRFRKRNLLDVWRVDRNGEKERFSAHDNIKNRKLLWHGTRIHAVAAILKEGLKILCPYYGRILGPGIYFAPEYEKSSCYVHCHRGSFERENRVGFMFLAEVALGKEWAVSHMKGISCSRLHRTPKLPKGYDSIAAKAKSHPDPKEHKTIILDGKKVVVPVGERIQHTQWKSSRFLAPEYVVFKESQIRLRYLVKLSFS